MEFKKNTCIITIYIYIKSGVLHNCVSRVAQNVDPLAVPRFYPDIMADNKK